MKRLAVAVVLALAVGGCKSGSSGSSWMGKAEAGQPIYATIQTSMGTIVAVLYSKESPKTVANFVGLASGEKEWRQPTTGEPKKTPFYDGTVFHRVIDGFMIQGGDPLGNGMGGPGYKFEDEVSNGKTFNKVGILAMANSGPNTNGSQFFITVSTPERLNGHYSIFGEVVKGYEVVEAISKTPRGANDRPNTPVTMTKITLSDSQP